MSLTLFETKTFNPRVIISKAIAYTVLSTDELVIMTGATARTFTLPALDSFQNTMLQGQKIYKLQNSGTADLTIQPGTSGNTGVADTINSHAVWTVKPNESIFITGYSNLTNWLMSSPVTTPALNRNTFAVVVAANGTTAVNVFDANGAPVDLDITEVFVNALDTIASNITVTGGASTVVVIAKGTSLSAIVPATTLSTYAAVKKGDTVTIVGSDASAAARVTIFGTTQSLIQ